ncbi:DUF6624 domain-containing protein [Massilia alkalitolerans]|uniref:DUF6624 domain-containing protein n=1 Tax=Massilia alkalitolerans TaxID=286638 RepID=UPI0004837183|nr:DUF6624 domain-containing protein [Massilia alkalitolerans]
MQRVILGQLFTAAILFAGSAGAHAAGLTHAALRDELLKMAASDQEVRQLARKGDVSRWAAVDDANRSRLKEIVAQHGWPTVAMVGQDGATAAWLIAQHADRDQAFQREVLALMEPLGRKGRHPGRMSPTCTTAPTIRNASAPRAAASAGPSGSLSKSRISPGSTSAGARSACRRLPSMRNCSRKCVPIPI